MIRSTQPVKPGVSMLLAPNLCDGWRKILKTFFPELQGLLANVNETQIGIHDLAPKNEYYVQIYYPNEPAIDVMKKLGVWYYPIRDQDPWTPVLEPFPRIHRHACSRLCWVSKIRMSLSYWSFCSKYRRSIWSASQSFRSFIKSCFLL